MKKNIRKIITPLLLLFLMIGAGITSQSQKEVVGTEAAVHSVTINRNSFPSGALAYRVDDKWTATGTDGKVYEGYFDIYQTATQTTMKSRPMSPFINHFHNTTPFPGRITKIEAVYGGGTARKLAPFLSPITRLNKDNYTDDGVPQLAKKPTAGYPAIWNLTGNDDRFVYLRIYDGLAELNRIIISFDVPPTPFGTLTGINVIPTSQAQTRYLTGETFSLAGVVVQAYDNNSPVVKKFVTAVTTNFDGVTFDATHTGTQTVVVVTYVEGAVTVTKTYQIQVNTSELITLVTSLSQIHYGARYALGAPALSVAMKAEHTTVFSKYDATYISGHLGKESATQLFSVEIGEVANSFAFKLVNGPSASNFLGLNENNTADELHVVSDLNDRSSWTITFSGNNAIITNVHFTTRTIRYNSTTLSFSTFTSGHEPVSLYVLESTISDATASLRLVNEINDGRGENAQNNCEAVYSVINSAYNQLAETERMTFNFLEDPAYVSARERKDYLQAWVELNVPQPVRPNVSEVTNNKTPMILIGIIGLSTLVGYYFIRKKKFSS